MKKSYIWTFPSRAFHWLFAVLITVTFFTDNDDFMKYHIIAGYAILILLMFRVYWGISGPKYSKFQDFPLSISKAKEFVANIKNEEQNDVGHNPMASYVMIGFFVIVFLTCLTGMLVMGIQGNKGLLSFIDLPMIKQMKILKPIHAFLADLTIVLIVAHLAGIFTDRVLHKKHETLKSIFTGYKCLKTEENIILSSAQKSVTWLFVVILAIFISYNTITPTKENILFKKEITTSNHIQQDKLK